MDKRDSDVKSSTYCWFKTMLYGFGSMVVVVYNGINEGQSAVMLPQLREPSSIIHVTSEDETWIASCGLLTAPISAILCGPFVDILGRKRGLQLFFMTMTVGFGIIGAARSLIHIYIGRVICGFAVGLEVAALVYMAEIGTKEQRSFMFALGGFFFSGGVAITMIVGGKLPWNLASAGFSFVSLIFFITQCFIPESPSWLYKSDRVEESKTSLKSLGRSDAEILKELESLQQLSLEQSQKVNFRTFFEPSVWKPFAILTLFYLLQCVAGIYDVLYFTYDFMANLGTSYDPLNLTILLATVRLGTNSTVGLYFTSKVRRRMATAISGFIMGISLLGTSVYEYIWRDESPALRPFQWLPVVLFLISIGASTLGVLGLPWMMSGELFPLRVRGAMSGASYLTGIVFVFVSIQLYPFLYATLKMYGLLLLMSLMSFVLVFFGLFILKETHNKTLYEIEESFIKKQRGPTSNETKC